MDRIYRRATQDLRVAKKKNDKNRKRNIIMNFRVSPVEKEIINKRIALTGMPKAEFFIESCMYQTILVRGNVRTFEEIRYEMERIALILLDKDNSVKLSEVDAESIRYILELLKSVFGNGIGKE